MFRRKWSALPEDPQFESSFEALGYFINKDDEIRSIENEDNYFKYFINRNPRINDRQRFALNLAVQAEIRHRLSSLGLLKLTLPFDADPTSDPHFPIWTSPDLQSKSRVIIIFGETHQDLGVLAHRVIDGPGGVDKGSMVSIVKALQQRQSSPTDPSAPGIILANMGELIWWPEGRRTLTRYTFDWAPMRSAAHLGNYIDKEVNSIRENENASAHVKYMFEKVLPKHVNPDAGLDIIGLGDGADVVESYLNSSVTWNRVSGRINCFASIGGQFPEWEIKCDGLRQFLKDRTRAYVPSTEPLNMVLSGPEGNPNTTTFTSLGCPVFSAGHPDHVEMLFIASHEVVLEWLEEVAYTPAEKKPYVNPLFAVVYSEPPNVEDGTWVVEVAEVAEHECSKEDGGREDKKADATEGQVKAVARDDMGSDRVNGDGSAEKKPQTLVIRPKKIENEEKG